MLPPAGAGSRYYHNPAAVISVPTGATYLYVAWQPTKSTPEELRAVYEQTLRGMQHFGLHKMLSDHAHRPPLPAEIAAWLVHDWIPRAVHEAGFSHCALVENSSPLGRLAAQAVSAQLPPGLIRAHYFATAEEASAWLLT